MNTRQLTEVANRLLEEGAGKRKQIPDLVKLVARAINTYSKSEDNRDGMLDLMIKEASIENGMVKVTLLDKNQIPNGYDDNEFTFTLKPRPYKQTGQF